MTNAASPPSGELRQNLVTGKWVVLAPGRGKRPSDFRAAKQQTPKSHRKKYAADCPFCNAGDFPQEPDILRLPDDPETWQVHVFANKYPAFKESREFKAWQVGPYRALAAAGYHELLATRWHNQHEATQSEQLFAMNIEGLLLRYRQLKAEPSVNYIQIIKNYGLHGGASLEHPHHQIFTTPVLPDDVHDMLRGAEQYEKQHGRDVFSALLEFERAEGARLVAENEEFVALCPFASRVPFETWIIPRQPLPFFEESSVQTRRRLAQLLQDVIRRLYVGLNDPSYNYVIHSAPCDETGFVCDRSVFQHYRWHVQMFPRLSTWGGFEFGTGLEINTMLPEEAAEYLRTVDTSAVEEVS